MKRRIVLVAACLALLAGVGWMVGRHASADAPVRQDAVADVVDAAATTDPELTALQRTPQAQAFRERQEFEARTRRFLQDASRLGAVERSEQARVLAASINLYEKNGGLSAGEALLLRSGLIKATVESEVQQAAQIADLMERYRTHADRRSAEYLAQHQDDPRFQDYKARERAIVAEVMAMRDIPGGLARDEYLRLRLQQARELAYGN